MSWTLDWKSFLQSCHVCPAVPGLKEKPCLLCLPFSGTPEGSQGHFALGVWEKGLRWPKVLGQWLWGPCKGHACRAVRTLRPWGWGQSLEVTQ